MFPYLELYCNFAALKKTMMDKKQAFHVIFSREARAFLSTLPSKARLKMLYNVDKAAGGEISKEIFKKLEGTDIWEFRTLFAGNAYRLLAFWDTEKDTLVVAANGFAKKTQKTPSKEIHKAEEIRRRYFETKH